MAVFLFFPKNGEPSLFQQGFKRDVSFVFSEKRKNSFARTKQNNLSK